MLDEAFHREFFHVLVLWQTPWTCGAVATQRHMLARVYTIVALWLPWLSPAYLAHLCGRLDAQADAIKEQEAVNKKQEAVNKEQAAAMKEQALSLIHI